MPSHVCTADDCRCRDGFPLYLANEGGGCLLLVGLARLALGMLSRSIGPTPVKLPVDCSRLEVKSPGLSMPTAESEIARPRCVVLGRSVSCACFSISGSAVFLGMKSQIEEPLDPLRTDGSGVLPRDTHTPSTSTPLSSALIPKSASSARGIPGPRRFWLISRCRACSLRSFSATTEYLRSRQCVCASFAPPRQIATAIPQARICVSQQIRCPVLDSVDALTNTSFCHSAQPLKNAFPMLATNSILLCWQC